MLIRVSPQSCATSTVLSASVGVSSAGSSSLKSIAVGPMVPTATCLRPGFPAFLDMVFALASTGAGGGLVAGRALAATEAAAAGATTAAGLDGGRADSTALAT